MTVFICVIACWAMQSVIANYHHESLNGVVNLFEKINHIFSTKLLQEIVNSNPGQNVVVSGYSVLQPLAQLSLGTTGQAHDELLEAIGMPDDDITKIVFPIVYNRVDEDVNNKGITARVVNKFYLPNGYKLNEAFSTNMEYLFHSTVQDLDFNNNIEAAKEINDMVKNVTENKIQDLIDPTSLAGDTTLILVNAVYFKGKWEHPFLLNNTMYRDFYFNKTFFAKVLTMFKTDLLKYGESTLLDARLADLPYVGKHFSFLVILPNQKDGLPSLLTKLLEPESLEKAMNEMKEKLVELYIPRIKIESKINLKTVLRKLGVRQIFRSLNSGLNRVVESGNIFLSDAVEKLFLEVNEEGTEAAAANEFMGSKSAPLGTTFHANHPFVYILKCGPTTLFSGVFLGYGDKHEPRDDDKSNAGKEGLRISFDVPLDVSYLPT